MGRKGRYVIIGMLYAIIGLFLLPAMYAAEEEEQSIIIEVDGDVQKHAEYVEKYYPYIDVITTYDTLFNGIALKAPPQKLHKIATLEFIQSIHPVRTYKLPTTQINVEKDSHVTTAHLKQSSLTTLSGSSFPFSKDSSSSQDAFGSNAIIPNALNNTTYSGKGVKVGVIDTGIDYTHPDLQTNYQSGYDLVDLDEDPMETDGSPLEKTIHGTHVAGIIAAKGNVQGVAPDAELYAYRALGPGGMGSTVQVLAALEKAVKDNVDLINLSLGNTVNGPDYPTSIAVNRAVELGITVVIASGNAGPDEWTVGSPATATKAITVGATVAPMKIPSLYEAMHDKSIPFDLFVGSLPWDLQKDYQVVYMKEGEMSLRGKIVLIQRGKIPFYEMAKKAQEQGAKAVLIYNNESGPISGTIENEKKPVNIPVASLSKADGEWLIEHMKKNTLYVDTTYEETDIQVAAFSSRGPVTLNWDMKPDILAPGTNIMSTVPGGYQMLQGTSMAAPHVTGVLALLKEAHPDWSPARLKASLETTATPIKQVDDTFFTPTAQGMGRIEPKDAIQTPTIIDSPFVSLGKITYNNARQTKEMTLTNRSDHTQKYSFSIPKSEQGISWKLPQTFTLEAGEEKTIKIEMRALPAVLKEGIHQGYLTLKEKKNTYQLPYLFLNKTADYPKAMGFEFSLKPLADDTYQYQLYLTDLAKQVTVDLYDPDTLLYQRTFLKLTETHIGINEGEMKKRMLGKPGYYKAIITVELEDGEFESYETEIAF